MVITIISCGIVNVSMILEWIKKFSAINILNLSKNVC